MPHLTLEYTSNIIQGVDSPFLFSALHEILTDLAGIQADNCKSRCLRLDRYQVGPGGRDRAFVHLTIRLLAGRLLKVRQEIARKSLGLLEETYDPSLGELDLQITVEVADMQPTTYFKAASAGSGERRHDDHATRV
jgi:5-carboxymethyl-2-hydroxymuconate isomerase